MSHRPYNFINGEKVNLKNEDHVKVVLDRNKKLARFHNSKFDLFEIEPEITISVKIECPCCGSDMTQDITIDSEDSEIIEDHITSVKCDTCKASVSKLLQGHFLQNLYRLKIPKTNKIIKN